MLPTSSVEGKVLTPEPRSWTGQVVRQKVFTKDLKLVKTYWMTLTVPLGCSYVQHVGLAYPKGGYIYQDFTYTIYRV